MVSLYCSLLPLLSHCIILYAYSIVSLYNKPVPLNHYNTIILCHCFIRLCAWPTVWLSHGIIILYASPIIVPCIIMYTYPFESLYNKPSHCIIILQSLYHCFIRLCACPMVSLCHGILVPSFLHTVRFCNLLSQYTIMYTYRIVCSCNSLPHLILVLQ